MSITNSSIVKAVLVQSQKRFQMQRLYNRIIKGFSRQSKQSYKWKQSVYFHPVFSSPILWKTVLLTGMGNNVDGTRKICIETLLCHGSHVVEQTVEQPSHCLSLNKDMKSYLFTKHFNVFLLYNICCNICCNFYNIVAALTLTNSSLTICFSLIVSFDSGCTRMLSVLYSSSIWQVLLAWLQTFKKM